MIEDQSHRKITEQQAIKIKEQDSLLCSVKKIEDQWWFYIMAAGGKTERVVNQILNESKKSF